MNDWFSFQILIIDCKSLLSIISDGERSKYPMLKKISVSSTYQ